jgi:ribosome-associated protein
MEEKLIIKQAETTDTEFWSEEEYRKLHTLKDAAPEEKAREIARILDNKRGRDIKILHVEDKTEIADYFVLCTANSNTHIKSLIGEVEYRMGLRGVEEHRVEGRDNGTWVIADYYHVILHVFSREAREFYNLDRLYGDLPEVTEEI